MTSSMHVHIVCGPACALDFHNAIDLALAYAVFDIPVSLAIASNNPWYKQDGNRAQLQECIAEFPQINLREMSAISELNKLQHKGAYTIYVFDR